MEREFTEQDLQQMDEAEKQLRASNSTFDIWTITGAQHNTQKLKEFFQNNPNVAVSVATIFKAIQSDSGSFKWLGSPEHVEFFKTVFAEGKERASRLEQLYPKSLIGKDSNPDQYFHNLSTLLRELHGHEITPLGIDQAQQRISAPSKHFKKQLHYAPVPRRVDPRSHVATDDGKPFVTEGLTKQRDGSLGKSPADYAREARARSAANNPQQPESQATIQGRAKHEAEMVRGNSHQQDIQIQRLFVTVGSEIDWPATLKARLDLQARLTPSRSIR